MKKIFSLLLSLLLIITSSVVLAKEPVVKFNGTVMKFESPPYISNERTMVPFRAIFEKVGAEVMWDDMTKTVIAMKSKGDNMTSVTLQINNDVAFVDGKEIKIDSPAVIKDNVTFVPLRFVIESLGAHIEWDQDSYTVLINTN